MNRALILQGLVLLLSLATFPNIAAGFTDDYESVMELYYRAELILWLAFSPSIQYIANPGGDESVGDAVVLGLRAQMSF
jgi:porin